ncbi:rhodanese-like domain-containing protein [Marininema halotolerans]|uniref:Rhodanese-related sulfurtransferase n=1 Tax=Marininema halotolerans TaxID=1155944 RepID=A0A1I6QB31_9BACL|nr:rhodanese-like domain-containing protein [Marininema halotolerans]SFS49671.1 Rhodanese-related sulfurtransferase [Marininema halotolerans]
MSEQPYTNKEARELGESYMENKKRFVWVDVRTEEEFAEGHIPESIHIPFDEMEERHSELAGVKAQDIMLICRSGRRSVVAAHILAEEGFQNLFNLKGGMLEWTGPTEK